MFTRSIFNFISCLISISYLYSSQNESSILHLAVQNGNKVIVELLVSNGTPADAVDAYGNSPLHYAVYLNDIQMARVLLAGGANPNHTDKNGFSPLYSAVYQGNFEMVNLLIAAHADPGKRNLEGETVLYFMKMLRPPKYKEIISLIKKHTVALKYLEKEKILLKRIGHIWKIEKSIQLNPKDPSQPVISFELTGAHPTHFYRYLKKRICQENSEFFAGHTEHLKEFLKYGSQSYLHIDADLIFKRIQSGKPTPISIGWCEHAVQLLFWKDKLVICNRGEESHKSIEMFYFDISKLNIRLIEKLLLLQTKDKTTFEKMLSQTLPNLLKLEKGDFERYFEKYSLITLQNVGNCAWDSVEGIMYAFIVLDSLMSSYLNKPADERLVRRVMLQKFGELKRCLSFLKFETLEHYLDHHLEGHSLFHVDQELLLCLMQKIDFDDFKIQQLLAKLKLFYHQVEMDNATIK